MDPDPNFANKMGCYGFAFTMPDEFNAPDHPLTPLSSLFVNFTTDSYFVKDKVTFNNKDMNGMMIKSGAACEYTTVPVQPQDG